MKNNRGLSILEVLLSIGISSMIALGTTYAVVTSMNGMSHVKNMNLAEDSIQLVSGMLTDPNYCSLHFNGLTVPTVMDSVIQSGVVFKDMNSPTSLGTTEIFKEGQKYQSTLEISSIKLYVETKVGTNRFIGAVRVTYKGASGMVSHFSRSTSLFIDTDAASKIVGCSRNFASSLPSIGLYSKDCTDYATKGWGSKDQCLQDGKWHLVYSSTAAGVASFGVLNDLVTHVDAGASVKVMHPPGTLGLRAVGDTCAATTYVISDGIFLCIPSFRFGVPSFPAKTGEPQTGLYYSDGVIVLMNNSTTEAFRFNAPMDWFIKY